jgi:rubrerythrin
VEKMMEYAGDAEAAGDADAATVFRTVAEGNRVAAQALLKRLKVHLSDF